MAQANIPRREERILIAELALKLMGISRGYIREGHAARSDLGLMMAAIILGHFNGQPFTAHKLAMFLDMPRGTVMERLNWLEANGYIERKGRVYCVSQNRLASTNPYAIDDVVRAIIETADKLRARPHAS